MPNIHLRGSNNHQDIIDAEVAAANGDIRLAVFLLGQHHGSVFTNLWQFVSDQKITEETPSAVRFLPDNRQ